MHTRDGDGGNKALCRAVVLHIPTEHTDPCYALPRSPHPAATFSRCTGTVTGHGQDVGLAGLSWTCCRPHMELKPTVLTASTAVPSSVPNIAHWEAT